MCLRSLAPGLQFTVEYALQPKIMMHKWIQLGCLLVSFPLAAESQALQDYLAEQHVKVRALPRQESLQQAVSPSPMVTEAPSASSGFQEVFSDTALRQLEQSGVDTKALNSSLERGDFERAKEILNRVGQEKTLEETEEELAELVQRRIRMGKMRKELSHSSGEDVSSDTAEKGKDVEGSETGEKDERVRLIRQTTPSAIPGYPSAEEKVYIRRTVVNEEGDAIAHSHEEIASSLGHEAENYDLLKLKEIGIRKLIPGMNLFRFAHHRFSEWETNERMGKGIVRTLAASPPQKRMDSRPIQAQIRP